MQITSVTLTDAATTPVARVFSRWKTVNDVITLLYRSASMTALAANKLTIGRRDGAPSNGNSTKVTFQLTIPTLAEVSPSTSTGVTPQPVVAYEHFGKIELVLPGASTLQERKDLLSMMRDLLEEAVVTSMIQDLDLPY